MKKIFVLILILSGCASDLGYKYWHKNGKNQDDFAKVRYHCTNQYYGMPQFEICMNSYGYYLFQKDIE